MMKKLKGWVQLFQKTQAPKISPDIIAEAKDNPFLQSMLLHDTLLGSIECKLENAYRIIAMLSVVIVIAMIGFVVVAGQSRVQPYLTVLRDNELLTVTDVNAADATAFKPKLASMLAKTFIQSARTVSVDRKVNHANSIKAYSYVRGAAAKRLNEFYDSHNPDVIAQKAIHTIRITTLLQRSDKTLDIRWQEEVRSSKSGQVIESRPYSAEITYSFDNASSNHTIAQNNPMGFYIDQLVWAEDAR